MPDQFWVGRGQVFGSSLDDVTGSVFHRGEGSLESRGRKREKEWEVKRTRWVGDRSKGGGSRENGPSSSQSKKAYF